MSERLLEEQFALLRAKCDSGAMRDGALLKARFKALNGAVRAARQEILGAFQSDCARSGSEVWRDEIVPVLQELRRANRQLAGYGWPARTARFGVRTAFQPHGVVLVTADWGKPFFSMMTAVINAAAAGNCVMLKVTPEAQSVMAVTVRLLKEVFQSDEVLPVNAELTELLALPFDAVCVNGDRDSVLHAAETMARRLGFGRFLVWRKHWCVVLNEADVACCARMIVRKKFRNAGQYADAPDCVLVHKSVKDALMIALRRSIRGSFGDSPEESRGYARIVNDFHYERLAALLREGRLVTGGEHHPDDRYIAPTVIDNLEDDSVLLRDPVRGPILPVFEFETLGEALDLIRRRPEARFISAFGAGRRSRKRLMGVKCEMVCFNDVAEAPCNWTPEDFRLAVSVRQRWSLRQMLLVLLPGFLRRQRAAARRLVG